MLFSPLFSYFTSKRTVVYLPQAPLILACGLLAIAYLLSRAVARAPSVAQTAAAKAEAGKAADRQDYDGISYMAPTV